MTAALELVQRVPLFSRLSKRELQMIAASLRALTFRSGERVAVEGEGDSGFFLIEAGSASVAVGGRELQRLGPGESFGEIALITKGARTATVTAESELRCYGMTSWDFRPLVQAHPSVAWKLLETLAQRLADAG